VSPTSAGSERKYPHTQCANHARERSGTPAPHTCRAEPLERVTRRRSGAAHQSPRSAPR
jgi:hypothetical protein